MQSIASHLDGFTIVNGQIGLWRHHDRHWRPQTDVGNPNT
jgi:hypothetical protein